MINSNENYHNFYTLYRSIFTYENVDDNSLTILVYSLTNHEKILKFETTPSQIFLKIKVYEVLSEIRFSIS